MLHQSCQNADTTPNTFKCTFEEGHFCNFTPNYNPNQLTYIWKIYNGLETKIKTVDHTYHSLSGHYLALDFGSQITDGVIYAYTIQSKKFPPSKNSCVTLSYFMSGLTRNETLNLNFKSENQNYWKNMWFAKGELGPFWYSHRMTVSSTTNWQIALTASVSGTRYGMIAFDDIIVEIDKPCPPKGKCDFEVNSQSF